MKYNIKNKTDMFLNKYNLTEYQFVFDTKTKHSMNIESTWVLETTLLDKIQQVFRDDFTLFNQHNKL